MSERTPASVDFFADVSCPWCYVGWEALKRAAEARPDIALSVAWRTFLLSPEMPAEGIDRRAYLKERFGGDAARLDASRAALEKVAAEAGAPIDADAATRIPNTIDAHRLIHWAANESVAEGVIDLIFAAYHVHGRDIGAREVLIDIAAKAGLDGARVGELLASDADRDLILTLHKGAADLGITGVPVVILNRRAALFGAQSPEVYARALDDALAAAN